MIAALSSGILTSVTEIWGLVILNFVSSASVRERIPEPLRPITRPGLFTNKFRVVPTGVFTISTPE